MSESFKRIFGIDLGTTYSSIAYVDEYGKAVVVPNAENQRTTPSVVFFDGESIVVGEVAKESARIYPNEVVSFIKRSMGEPDYLFEHDGKTYRAEEISSFVLRKVVQDAEQNLGQKIVDIVITCPAYFGIAEREATRMAGEIAGFNVRQVINEPTAAAIAYGTVEARDKRVVLVYDLGGGTFDVTMIDIQPDSIEVICTGGDHNLGGKDWDDRIVSYLVEQFQTQTGSDEDILEDPDTWQDLQLTAERSKKILSQRDKTPVSITHGGERVKIELRRDKFEEITRDLMERTVLLTHEMIAEAKKKGYHHFDEIILVGGSTRIPMCSQRIREEFKMEPKIFDPDEAVAKGAAIYGWKLSLNDSLIKRIAEKTHQKIEHIEKMEDIRSAAPEQIVKEITRQLAEETGYTLPALERSMVRIRNVASKSFGIIVLDPHGKERVFNLILRNTPVPANISKDFFTAIENQKSVLIRIMENESSELSILPDQAVEIGTAVLSLPPNLPKDLAVRISFRLNEEGRLQMSALETAQQRSVEVMIETASIIGGEELAEAKRRAQALVVH